jgi:hypothetical protein
MPQQPSGPFALPPAEAEPLSRFLLSKRRYSVERMRVKSAAFLPEPNSLETSVFRTLGLEEEEIWTIGEHHVAQATGHTLHGRGQVLAQVPRRLGLNVRPDNQPERHAAIVGWPAEKDRQQMLAIELAEEATLFLK